MATKITQAVRATIKAIVADSRDYDASTVVIDRDGVVSAIKDADKTFNGPETIRFDVGHIDDMVAADGQRREGW